MSCEVDKATEGLENELCSPGELSVELATQEKSKKGWRMNCDVGEATEGLENELILQHFRHFTYITAHSPTLLSLYLRHSSFFNPSVASPTSQLIHQPIFCFSYVTGSSLTSPGEPPMQYTFQNQQQWRLVTCGTDPTIL